MTDGPDTMPGAVTWLSSDGESGPDVGMSIGLGDGRSLWVGEISRDLWEDGGEDVAGLGDDFGWWLILYGPNACEVLGKFVTADSARQMMDALAGAFAMKAENA